MWVAHSNLCSVWLSRSSTLLRYALCGHYDVSSLDIHCNFLSSSQAIRDLQEEEISLRDRVDETKRIIDQVSSHPAMQDSGMQDNLLQITGYCQFSLRSRAALTFFIGT